jgi:hypothetical protein
LLAHGGEALDRDRVRAVARAYRAVEAVGQIGGVA